MRKLNICLLLLLIVLILNQSCLVIGRNNSSRWYKDKQKQNELNIQEPKPDVVISLKRHQATLIIPFVFIEWYNKNYQLSFRFSTKENIYKNIDSVKFTILNIDSSLIFKDICYEKPFSIFSNTKGPYFQAEIETDYNLIIPKKKKDDLIIILSLYLKNNLGEDIMYNYHFILKRDKDKWLDAGFFQV